MGVIVVVRKILIFTFSMEIKPQSGVFQKGVRSESYNCALAKMDQATFPKHGTPLKRMDVKA